MSLFQKEKSRHVVAFNDEQKTVIIFNKKIDYSQLKEVKLLVSGVSSTIEELQMRLDPQLHYLDYYAMTSLEVVIMLKSPSKSEVISFFKTPYQASEKERLALAREAIDIVSKLTKLIKKSNHSQFDSQEASHYTWIIKKVSNYLPKRGVYGTVICA
ncbi:hypothetical protein ACVRZD_05515 [Streptococcus hongkongensis]